MTRVQEFQAALNEARHKVKETEDKIKVALPERRAAALAALDASALRTLSDAGRKFAQDLQIAKIAEAKALLALLDAQRRENTQRRTALEAESRPIHAQIVELQKQIAPLNDEIGYLAQLYREHSSRERDAKRKLEDLLFELQTDIAPLDAPVVRSIPHMGR